MIDVEQFRALVIQPALERIGLYSEDAEELLLGTAIQESRLTYLAQLGNGPARGVFQMEPVTHNDIWINWLPSQPTLRMNLKALAISGTPQDHPDPDELIWNLRYAAAMCRAHYRRKPGALPEAGDLAGQAAYWKKWYNTELGAGTEDEYIHNWNEVMS